MNQNDWTRKQKSRETVKDDIYRYNKLILNISHENKNTDVSDYSLVLLQEIEPVIHNECFYSNNTEKIQLKFSMYESPNNIISYSCSSESYT